MPRTFLVGAVGINLLLASALASWPFNLLNVLAPKHHRGPGVNGASGPLRRLLLRLNLADSPAGAGVPCRRT
jgi:hypothetical protein